MSRPNILYLHSHDTGRYVQPYGHAIATPRIQGLAEEGMLFRKAFCAASTCSASRACFLTGQYAHQNGMLGLAHRGWSLNDYNHHMVHTLHDVGYRTTLVGEQHISKEPDVIGYDRVVKIDTSRVDDVAPVAVDLLRQAAADDEPPFFMSIGFFETHREFFEPLKGEEHYIRPPAHLPDVPAIRRDMASFVASARSLDRGVGAVLDALDRYGHAANTLVICTTDHGIAFPGCKATMTDRGIGVMLIMRGPGGFLRRQGERRDGVAHRCVPDALPAARDRPARLARGGLAGAAGARPHRPRCAMRCSPRAPTTRPTNPSGACAPAATSTCGGSAIATAPVLANTDDSPSKDVWLEAGWPQNLLDR